MQKVSDVFEELLYEGSPLSWDVAGTKETVGAIKQGDFIKYREMFYYPKNMVLAIAGKFEQDGVLKLAEKYFGGIKNGGSGGVEGRKKAMQMNPGRKPGVKLVTKKTEQAHLVLGVRGNPLGHPDRYVESVMASILGGGMSSRLFTEIRERRGLAYYVRCAQAHYTDNGHLSARAGVRLDKIEETVSVILREYNKLKNSKVKNSELKKAKEYLKGRFALGLEDTYSMADFAAEQEILEGKIETIEEIMAGIDNVAISDIQRLAQEFFQNERLNLTLIGPFEDETKFKRLLKF